MHARRETYICTHTHTHTHTHAHLHMHLDAHASTPTNMHPHVHTYFLYGSLLHYIDKKSTMKRSKRKFAKPGNGKR